MKKLFSKITNFIWAFFLVLLLFFVNINLVLAVDNQFDNKSDSKSSDSSPQQTNSQEANSKSSKYLEYFGFNQEPINWYVGVGMGKQAHTLNNATEYSFDNAKDLKDAYYGYVKVGYEWKYAGLEAEIQSANTLDQNVYFSKIDKSATISYDAWDFSVSGYMDMLKSSKYTFAPVLGLGFSKLKSQPLDGLSPLKQDLSVAIRYGLMYRQKFSENFAFELGAISKLMKGQVALNYVQDKITIHNFNFNMGFIYNLHK